jgi:hypothetical protein
MSASGRSSQPAWKAWSVPRRLPETRNPGSPRTSPAAGYGKEGVTLQAKGGRQVDPQVAESILAHGETFLIILALAPGGTSQDGTIQLEKVRYLLKRWYGEMSRKCHPDMGGSAEKQACVNECYRSMNEILRGESQRMTTSIYEAWPATDDNRFGGEASRWCWPRSGLFQ